MDLQDKPLEFVDLYARANPIPGARAKVPLLQVRNAEGEDTADDDFVLCESLVVSEYVAEAFSDSRKDCLWLESPEDRAKVRLFTEMCGSAFSYFPMVRAATGGDADDEKFTAALESFKEGLVAADAFLRDGCGGGRTSPLTRSKVRGSDGSFLLGDRFSLAECNAAPFVQRCCAILPAFTGPAKVDPLLLCDEMGLNRLRRWMDAVLARQSVMDTGVPADAMKESTTRMLERFAAMEQAVGATPLSTK